MELDEVGIDRFFDAIGEMPLSAEIGYLPEEEYHVQEEERKPKLEIRAGASGVFLVLEDLHLSLIHISFRGTYTLFRKNL